MVLRVIAGLAEQDGGRVFFNDIDVTRLPPAGRDVGILFDYPAGHPAYESHSQRLFALQLSKQPISEERLQRVVRSLNVDRQRLLALQPMSLPAGEQQQRLALARALLTTPSILLMEEPLARLDPQDRTSMRAQLKRLLQELQLTTVLVTNHEPDALALADRIAVMHKGRMEQVGTWGEVYLRPTSVFVARFLGNTPMNILRGHIREGALWIEGAQQPLVPPPTRRRPPDGPLLIGVRPEHLVPSDAGTLPMRVLTVERHFDRRLEVVSGQVGEQPLIAHLPPYPRYQTRRRSVSHGRS